jgi:hypothetical protein
MVKASTQGLRVRDAFYIRTKNKEKVYDKKLLEKVQNEILELLKNV